MKALKIGLLSLLLAPTFASDAHAYTYSWDICTLLPPSDPVVRRGYMYRFTFYTDVRYTWPYSNESSWEYMPLTMYWHGTKNGVPDTPPGGVFIKSFYAHGQHDTGAYTNPLNGAWAGTYVRRIEIRDSKGRTYCMSTPAQVTLL
jgi:hypothetical protein